jgi:uncharacterized protein (DUF1684 family)
VNALELADFRARTAALYLSNEDLAGFRARRDELFATHPQSAAPGPLRYFPWSESFAVTVRPEPADGPLEIATGGEDGVLTYERVAFLPTPWGRLTLFWLSAYGGGLFLPFRDATSGHETYGAGRYLTDTIKGTHGRGLTMLPSGELRLDFNYAYNPSCAYDDRWACPLAPWENRLTEPIRAGELSYHE